MTTQSFSPRTGSRLFAFVLASLVTAAMLGGVDHLATSAPPAGLVAQIAHAMSNA